MVRSEATKTRPRVVVGIDGSADAREALRQAVREAQLRDAQLDVVHVWSPPFKVAPWAALTMPFDPGDPEKAAHQLLDERVDGAVGRDRRPPVRVERILVNDHSPARALTDAATGAELLVVGSRGHGGFAGLLLGSVSQQCVHHAPCPVLVVHARHDGQDSRMADEPR